MADLEQIRLKEAIQNRQDKQLHQATWGPITYQHLMMGEYQWHEHTPTESFPHGIMTAEIEIGLEVEVSTLHISGETYGWS